MKPIYYPFTYISSSNMTLLRSCFNQIAVYQPSHHHTPRLMGMWAEKGILDIQRAVKGDEKIVDAAVHELKSWINLRQGVDPSVLKAQQEKIPYFDDTLISQIKSTITIKKRGPKRKDPS